MALLSVSDEGCLLTCGENMLCWAAFRPQPVATASEVFGKHIDCVWCQVAWAPVPDSSQLLTLFLERIVAARVSVNKAFYRLDF